MKSVKAACLVLLAGLTCLGIALVAGAPGQQKGDADPKAAYGALAAPGQGAVAGVEDPSVATPEEPRGPYSAPASDVDPAVTRQQALGAYQAAYGVPPESPEATKWRIEGVKTETEQYGLLAKYTSTTDAKERAEIRASLAKVIGRQFDLQQQQREREVSEIEARVKKLREMIAKRNAARQTIVTGRLDQLLNEMDGMGWVSPGGPGPRGGFRFDPYGPARSGYPGAWSPPMSTSDYTRGSGTRSADFNSRGGGTESVPEPKASKGTGSGASSNVPAPDAGVPKN